MRVKKLAGILTRLLKPAMIHVAKGEVDTGILRHPWLVNTYMQARFEYVTDKELFGMEDRPQTALEMIEREKGDCEDWAEVARVLLDPVYEPFLFYVGVRDREATPLNPPLSGGKAGTPPDKGELEGVSVPRAHMACVFLDDDQYSYIHTGGYRKRIVPKRPSSLIPVEIDLASHIAADVYPGTRLEDYFRAAWNGERWQPAE